MAIPSIPRRFGLIGFLTLSFILIAGSFLSRSFAVQKTSSSPSVPLTVETTEEKPKIVATSGSSDTAGAPSTEESRPAHVLPSLRITITETGGSHDEVVAALVHSFGSISQVSIDLYQLLPRFGIQDIMKAFSLPHPIMGPKPPSHFKQSDLKGQPPNVFVASTCELDIKEFRQELETLRKQRKTYLVCVVHHADRWSPSVNPQLEELIRPWVEDKLVEFWALSPHTALFMNTKSVRKWKTTAAGIEPVVRHFVPVFPVQLPSALPKDGAGTEMSFSVQGDYDPSRRDYNSIFGQLESFIRTGGPTSPNITMHLIGHGQRPQVPESVRERVVFNESPSYFEFYSILARSFAIVPAFASTDYLDRKASSSVPAALIAGTPLVATREIVSAYQYLSENVVWLQQNGETDLEVVRRALAMTPQEISQKKQQIRTHCQHLVERNIDWVESRLHVVVRLLSFPKG